MSLSHDSFTFGGSSLHGDIVPQGSFQPQLLTEEYFGVKGEAHLIGETGGRSLTCDYTLSGFASAALLQTAIENINAKIGELTGTLSVSGNMTLTFAGCTFVGFEHQAKFLDGSGVNGWCVHGRLHWRQREQG